MLRASQFILAAWFSASYHCLNSLRYLSNSSWCYSLADLVEVQICGGGVKEYGSFSGPHP